MKRKVFYSLLLISWFKLCLFNTLSQNNSTLDKLQDHQCPDGTAIASLFSFHLCPCFPRVAHLILSTSRVFLTKRVADFRGFKGFCGCRAIVRLFRFGIFCVSRVSTSLIGVKNSCCFPFFPFGISGLWLGFWPIYTSFQGWRLCCQLWNKCDLTKNLCAHLGFASNLVETDLIRRFQIRETVPFRFLDFRF